MQAVARQRQKLQGFVKAPRLEKLKARGDAVDQEDTETAATQRCQVASESRVWARTELVSPRGGARPPQGPGSLPALDSAASQPASIAHVEETFSLYSRSSPRHSSWQPGSVLPAMMASVFHLHPLMSREAQS